MVDKYDEFVNMVVEIFKFVKWGDLMDLEIILVLLLFVGVKDDVLK